mgnify:CR=1 FL=1
MRNVSSTSKVPTWKIYLLYHQFTHTCMGTLYKYIDTFDVNLALCFILVFHPNQHVNQLVNAEFLLLWLKAINIGETQVRG